MKVPFHVSYHDYNTIYSLKSTNSHEKFWVAREYTRPFLNCPESVHSGEYGESCDSGESGDFGEFVDSGDFVESSEFGNFGESGDPGDSGDSGESGDSSDSGDSGSYCNCHIWYPWSPCFLKIYQVL